MERAEIAALAEGMVPFVREVVTEATAPLLTRIAKLEARPAEKGDAGELAMLPPEIAEQVASAVRLLNESPPIKQRAAPQPSPPPRVARIERDEEGNLVPIYADD